MLKRTVLAKSLLLAFSGSAVVWSATALAQTAAPADQPTQLQRVEVTGSSIKRIDAESALPVQVITREQIQKTGAANVEQLLQSISSMASSQGLTSASASGATTGGISAVSIHGLSSSRTLVLVPKTIDARHDVVARAGQKMRMRKSTAIINEGKDFSTK